MFDFEKYTEYVYIYIYKALESSEWSQDDSFGEI